MCRGTTAANVADAATSAAGAAAAVAAAAGDCTAIYASIVRPGGRGGQSYCDEYEEGPLYLALMWDTVSLWLSAALVLVPG